jgi:ribose-phosphate pyrophosphokinase
VKAVASASLWGLLTSEQGETSVKILTSIREKDVFIVQSGSKKINDSIMELLIMISACKGGSANKITGLSHHMLNVWFADIP